MQETSIPSIHSARKPGREQPAGLGTGGIHESKLDGGGGSGNAIDRGVSFIRHFSVRRQDAGFDQFAGIDVVDADGGDAVTGP